MAALACTDLIMNSIVRCVLLAVGCELLCDTPLQRAKKFSARDELLIRHWIEEVVGYKLVGLKLSEGLASGNVSYVELANAALSCLVQSGKEWNLSLTELDCGCEVLREERREKREERREKREKRDADIKCEKIYDGRESVLVRFKRVGAMRWAFWRSWNNRGKAMVDETGYNFWWAFVCLVRLLWMCVLAVAVKQGWRFGRP